MTEEQDPKETEAITQMLGGRDVEVTERDFRRPKRLSALVREGLKRRIEMGLPNMETYLSDVLGSAHTLQLDHVRETTAEGLFDDLESPLAALVVEIKGSPAWLVWESAPAVGCVEQILGAATDEPKARVLSMVEAKIIEGLLARVVKDLAEPFDLNPSSPRFVQAPEALGDWRDAPTPDSHRLEIALGLVGPGSPSSLRVYLPHVQPKMVAHLADELTELPIHLDNVIVDVSAQLPGCEVSLDQLLALEKGDVIPIESRLGDPALLTVEGLILAKASMGHKNGQLAVRIEELESSIEEIL